MISIFKRSNNKSSNLYEIKDYFCITKIQNHFDIKSNLLEAISCQEDSSLNLQNNEHSISSTDFFSDDDNSYYKNIFIENVIEKYYDSSVRSLGHESYEILNIWYQQYKFNDTHNWHTHYGCNFSNVYFLELPSNEVSTEFLNIKTNNIFKVNGIVEGDLLSFPGHIIHRSPKNKTNYRKTVIVFNSSIYDT